MFATRRFARRQDSWLRKDPRVVWIRYDDPDLLDRCVEVVSRLVAGAPRTSTTDGGDSGG